MNIAIIDDNITFIDTLIAEISQLGYEMEIKPDISIIKEGHILINEAKEFDVIFLDIEMPDIDGIEIAKQINQNKGEDESPFIVFVSNKDNMVFTALKQFPFSFIRKSDLKSELGNCLYKIHKKLEKQKEQYTVKNGRNSVSLYTKEIIYIEKDKNYVVFKTADNEYRERSKIDDKLKELSHSDFAKPHVGYIVNFKHVVEMTTTEFVLSDGVKIPISKTYRKEVREKYFKWMVKQNA